MSTESDCPFCPPPSDRVVEEAPLAVAFNDANPVSPGHCLVVPRRHVSSWFDATTEERNGMMDLVDKVRKRLNDWNSPSGYNIGINIERAAGQTVFHLCVHLIPRYPDDVPNPRGGVRHVIPEKGNYFK